MWPQALSRWGLPLPDSEPLIVDGAVLPLVWRAHLAAAAFEPIGDDVRAALDALGFAVATVPEKPGDTPPRELVEMLRRRRMTAASRRETSSTRGDANGWRCRLRTTRLLCLRPLSGSEADVQFLHPALEREPVRPARFDMPDRSSRRPRMAARLLSDALRLSLRRGAGPFRSAARVGFEPRAYQLVPLLMALRLPIVRLLIADDVGIGKTIEAGLILRELIDRGEIDRFAVLCPPHLVEQWTGELNANSISTRSRSPHPRLPAGARPYASQTLFDAYPYTVVSLDYIKTDRRRESFARACPTLVVVDEAHACVGTHQVGSSGSSC